MTEDPASRLRRGWTTGACATAATKAALQILWGAESPQTVGITLPKGEQPVFSVHHSERGEGWAEAAIEKDAGDDPDVTHGAIITARVSASLKGVVFEAGEGVGIVTKPGLPLDIGEPAINPVPRQLMRQVVLDLAAWYGKRPDIVVTLSVANGAALAEKTWNPRLGIIGGLSILGTTGVVRPFSCAAWIASIHRGIDVARATKLEHVAGCTGASSEKTVQALYDLPDHAMLDMGDFAGGLLKYLRKHPIRRLTIGGGIGKMTKLAQGARDLHSKRSQVDFRRLSDWARAEGVADLADANTALEAYQRVGPRFASHIAQEAKTQVEQMLDGAPVDVDTVVIDRAGAIIGRAVS